MSNKKKKIAVIQCRTCKKWYLTRTKNKKCPFCGKTNTIGKTPVYWYPKGEEARRAVQFLNAQNSGDTTTGDQFLKNL